MKRFDDKYYVAVSTGASIISIASYKPVKQCTWGNSYSYKRIVGIYIDVDVFYSEIVRELCLS
jgi:hypothetical protein